MLTADQLATFLAVSPKTVYREWRNWGLKGYRIGGSLRFRKTEVEKWITSSAA